LTQICTNVIIIYPDFKGMHYKILPPFARHNQI
jgi:hypothetical protein